MKRNLRQACAILTGALGLALWIAGSRERATAQTPAQPDLVCVGATTVTQNNRTRFRVLVRNQGLAPALPSTVAQIPLRAGILQQLKVVPYLRPGQFCWIDYDWCWTGPFPWPRPWVRFTADRWNQVAEGNEANNSLNY